MPLYDQMSVAPDFVEENFKRAYSLIVKESPFAVFVNSHHSVDEILNETRTKIQKNRQYGLAYVAIHGLGAENVRKIHRVTHDISQEFELIPEINSTPTNIRVLFRFSTSKTR